MLRTALSQFTPLRAAGVRAAASTPWSAASSAPQLMPQRRHFNSREEALDACRLVETDVEAFLQKHVADDVMWTVTEPAGTSTPISKIYKSRDDFIKGALQPLSEHFDGPLTLKMVDTVVQPRDNTDLTKVCLELEGTAKLKSDQSEWKNYYSWVMHFRKQQAVVVRAYLDSAAVNKAMGKGQ